MGTAESIPELTRYSVTFVFRDINGNLTIPENESVSYRLIDTKTGAEIIPPTHIDIDSNTATIIIPAEKNYCLSRQNSREMRKLIITAAGLAQAEHIYSVAKVGP